MNFSAQQIAALINGTIEGNPLTTVNSFSKIEEAGRTDLAFLANPKYEEYLYTTQAAVIIVGNELVPKQPLSATLIRVAEPYTSFATLMQHYQRMQATQLVGIEDPVFIHPSASIGKDVYIGAFAYIGENAKLDDGAKVFPHVFIGSNAKLGKRSTLHAGVKIYHDCILGDDVTIHAGTVIGSDGFGFAPQQSGAYNKIPQLGNVVIEDQVEIGANACIDRATMGSTIIRKGTKLDNLLQIAHNVEVGENCVIAAQTGISGSTKIGKNAMIGGQVGIKGHIFLADGSKINAQSGVSKTIKETNKSVTGTPAFDYGEAMRAQAIFRKLPELDKKIQSLQNQLDLLVEEKMNGMQTS